MGNHPLGRSRPAVVVRQVPIPAGAVLLAGSVVRPNLADAFALDVPAGTTTDPQVWAAAIFRRPPKVVRWLLRLRNVVVAPFGIERGDESSFAIIASNDREVLLGTDAGHLDFRASVLVEANQQGAVITVSTLAAARSRVGRGYLWLVGFFHPPVVRAMLRHAAGAPQIAQNICKQGPNG